MATKRQITATFPSPGRKTLLKTKTKMKLKPIHTAEEHEAMLAWIDAQLNKGIEKGSAAGDKLEVALILVKAYEDRHYPIPMPDPIEAIKLKMEEKGIRNKDLAGKIGSPGYISSILNRRKPLTLAIARWMHKELGIPAQVLLSD